MRTKQRTEFGERVRAARLHAKLSQEMLGERTGLGQSTISYLEQFGESSNQTVPIAQACGVRAAWLAEGTGPMVGPEDEKTASTQKAAQQLAPYVIPPSDARDFRTLAYTLAGCDG
jgi:transcriptional regulator with XRE-family HTH domain